MDYVYTLQCSDRTLYTGWTNDLRKRHRQHMNGKASKYTRARLPVRYVMIIPCENESAARKLECRIKRLTRKEKLLLIEKNNLQTKELLSLLEHK